MEKLKSLPSLFLQKEEVCIVAWWDMGAGDSGSNQPPVQRRAGEPVPPGRELQPLLTLPLHLPLPQRGQVCAQPGTEVPVRCPRGS